MLLMKFLKILLIAALSAAGLYLLVAVGLVLSQWVSPLPAGPTLSFSSIQQAPGEDPGLTPYVARDGSQLEVRHYAGSKADGPLVMVIHGSGWHGGAYTAIGQYLSQNLGYEVLIPDLRGHGLHPQRRGDIDYIGQLEDDLADLIALYRKSDRPVYVIGHSSGGGLAIRFAGGRYGKLLSRVVLMAPFLKYDAPTARDDAGGWSHVLMRRVIGQTMLNAVGITAFNSLHMIQFNFPAQVLESAAGKAATTSYSYRLNASFAPRNDYLADVAKLPKFLLIAGREDEAFRAEAYQPTLSAVNPNGHYELIEGVDHLGLISAPRALQAIADFLK